MKLFYKLLFAAVAAFSFSICFGQNNEWPVRFANGNFITGNNVEKQTFKKENISNALFGDKYFVLIQFSSLPSTSMQQKMKDAGIELNNYLPEHTYLAAVKNTFDFGRAKDFNIISINSIPSFYKINKKFTAYKPSFNKEEEQAIAVNYFEQADKNAVSAALKNKGAFIFTEKFNAGGIILIQYNKAIIDSIAALPFVMSLGLQPAKDQLLNYNSRAAHAVSGLNAWGGKNLNGKGVTVGVGDNADVSTHIDFTGRLINRNPNTPTNHGTHTTGTTAGAGIIDPKYRGMASKATIVSQSFSDIIVYAPSYITDYDMVVTNNSYHSANVGCSGEQEYDGLSRYGDEQMNTYDKLQHVFAAGNDGNSTCSPYPTSFATVKTGWQCAKNILTVGALNVSNNTIASYSGRGPTLDGRIKPEITTDGYAVHSTNAYNTYGDNYGTSMACPGATGSLALMYERYRQTHAGADPKSALIKAVACNTAEDLGNTGPDYTYGFGMLNTRRAVEALDSNRYFTSSITNGGSNTHNITVPANTRRLKIMLYWNDIAAASNAATTLVNDLDLVAIEPSLTLHRPMSLDATPANVNNVATEAPDHKNNIEQVVIENPAAGVYSANINGFNIPSGTQEYVVTYEILKNSVTVEYPFGGETLVPGEADKIRWNAYGSEANNFTIEYSSDNGGNWTTVDNNVSSTTRIYNWTVPSTATNNALIRISRNGTLLSDQSNFNFTILEQPVVAAANACEGAVQLSWPAITNATSYDIYQLIGDSMQVIGNTVSNTYLITGLDKNKMYWFGAAAKNNTVSGRRSISVSITPNSGTCSLAAFNNDLKVDTILEPNTARQFFSNIANATKPVKIVIKNLGTVAVSGPFDVSFKYSSAAAITETVNTTINAGATYTYTFTGMYALPPGPGYNYDFKAWVTKSSDNNHSNDTAYKNVKYINNNPIAILPITENFDGMSAAEFTKAEMAIGGNKYLDFGASSTRGRARSFVNTGFSLSGANALTLDQTPYSNSANADSAVLNYNLSLFASDQIRFDFYYKNHGQADANGNKIWIRGSENNNWVQAYDLFASQADIGEWKKGIINVNEVLGNAVPAQTMSETFQIKIGEEGNNSANSPEPIIDADDGYTFDNLVLSKALNDVAVLDFNLPDKTGCGLSANNPVSIKIKNYNNIALSNVQVNYKINNGAVVTEIIPSLAANQTLDYSFTQTANFSALIDYSIDVWVKYAGDNYAANDSILNYTIHSSPVISTYPYLQDFENSNGNFYAYGTNSTWQWGTPAKSFINKAANGTKAWVTNLTGAYSDYETSYLGTPCFDLTGLNNPVLSFSHIYQSEQDYDYTWVEYSTDGKTWNKLGNINEGTNWYNDASTNSWNNTSARWQVASIDIPVTNTTVRFRFVMSSDGGVTEEGIGIDDVRIFEKSVIADAISPSSIASAVVSGNNWVVFNLTDSIIAEINANGQNLGTVTVQPYLNTNGIKNSNNQYYLNRNYVIRSTNPAAGDVSVRLYFTDTEADDLINATGCSTCTKPGDAYSFGITRYVESYTEDNGSIDDNFYNSYKFIQPTKIIPHYNGYYAEFSADNFCEFWFSKGNIIPTSNYVCQGSSVAALVASSTGTTYQWQVDMGSGYTNISNGANYSGATTATLQLSNLLTSFTGYKYRCAVDGVNGSDITLRFKNVWTGSVSTDWFTAGNWACGLVPDQYTDVVVPSGATRYPTLTANTVIRSIRMLKNAPVNINAGVRLDLNGR
jgi:hypothetical protein